MQEIVNQMERMIADNSYLAPVGETYPILMETDEVNRVYRIRWREFNGSAYKGEWVTREFLFPPRMRIVVKAIVQSDSTAIRYGYRIENGPESEDALHRVRLEAPSLTRSHVQFLSEQGEPGYPGIDVGGGRYLHVEFPSLKYIQDYTFWIWRPRDDDDTGVSAQPGEILEIPPVFSVPWESLPGVLTCWIKASNYRIGVSGHTDPTNVQELFAIDQLVPGISGTLKKVFRFAYHGRTVGPVPAPGPGTTRNDFLATIQGYLQEAREWGWCPGEQTADALEAAMEDLAGGELEETEFERRLKKLLQMVEEASHREDILYETWALLTFNLRHLKRLPPQR
ncbi:MAG: hypothetical protein ACRD1R_16345 [Acidobacteriota bacterium]